MPTLTLQEQTEYEEWCVLTDYAAYMRSKGVVHALEELIPHLGTVHATIIGQLIDHLIITSGKFDG